MKKLFAIFFIFVLTSLCAIAQKKLDITDVTPQLSVYPCGDRAEALVVIRCSEDFDLMFVSNVDNDLAITTSKEGSEKIYNIVFPTKMEGTSYKGRMLTIIAPGFTKSFISLELSSKEKREYLVSDPYSSLRSIYYLSIEEGLRLMENGGFVEAGDKFRLAKSCPEYKTESNNVDIYIESCDSAQVWYTNMRRYERIGRYDLAVMYANRIVNAIPSCGFMADELISLRTKFNDMCLYNKTIAEQYIKDNKLEEAKELLERNLEIGGRYAIEAKQLLSDIEKKIYNINNKTRSFSYQYAIGRPIGFMTARLKPKGVGAYFSLGFNKECIDLLSDLLDAVSSPKKMSCEAGLSLGLTIPIIPKYGWLMLSPLGYLGGGNLLEETKVENPDKKALENVTWLNGYAPEAGVEAKIWRFVIGYRFQYRYCLSKKEGAADIMGRYGHMFSLGFSW